jgi:hypothetical protein|tara:strand:- start:295 stop:558 length:264 start_codon:yes stop_codon:yes gene_type:complete
MADESLTADEINQHFTAMGHSVDLIDATIADDTEAKKMNGGEAGAKEMVKRNTDHLEIQLAKDWAKDDSRSKKTYTDAVTAGKAYIG